MSKKRLFSGIQPTGMLHIGNYIGAIQQWKTMQNDYDSLFCIVDLHAITVRQSPEELRAATRRTAATYIACGINPDESTIFVQSDVSAHAELAWILNTFAYMGELERMTQYKDKKAKGETNNNAGLFTYPVLMAADILLYDTQIVPVGEDQKQHVEIARNIAQRVNGHYEKEVFVIPEPLIGKAGARIMGLDDASKKMSKSASPMNYIALLDTPEDVRQKIMKAVTDSGSEVRGGEDKPEFTNLLTIYSSVTGKTVTELEEQYVGKGYGDFKKELADAVISWMGPIQASITELMNDTEYLDGLLDAGAHKAAEIAVPKLQEVYDIVGVGR
jgi:tryptophanyl-tRNA synthetase